MCVWWGGKVCVCMCGGGEGKVCVCMCGGGRGRCVCKSECSLCMCEGGRGRTYLMVTQASLVTCDLKSFS